MKFRKIFLFTLLPLLFMSSCETDVDLNAPWKDITVVYGLLNQNDTIHYVRLQRAYLGEGNALYMAAVADSNLYSGKTRVELQEWIGTTLRRTLILDTTTIANKEPGIFFSPKQPVYFTKASLNPEYDYKLNIRSPKSLTEVTAKTGLVRDFLVDRPSYGSNLNFTVAPETPITIRWYSGQYGKRYQVLLRFKYKEVITGRTDTTYRNIDWQSAAMKTIGLAGGELMEVKFNKSTLFSMITNNIILKQEVTRKIGTVELRFQVAADELSTFIEVNEPSSSIVQEKPEFTNINNGIGIFSSRYEKIREHELHPSTRQQILAMQGYNFQ